jgi:hypothetical protein
MRKFVCSSNLSMLPIFCNHIFFVFQIGFPRPANGPVPVPGAASASVEGTSLYFTLLWGISNAAGLFKLFFSRL